MNLLSSPPDGVSEPQQTIEDAERTNGSPELDLTNITDEKTRSPQPSRRDWILTCIGLSLGALLYGSLSTPLPFSKN
jgi:hypothetical protein